MSTVAALISGGGEAARPITALAPVAKASRTLIAAAKTRSLMLPEQSSIPARGGNVNATTHRFKKPAAMVISDVPIKPRLGRRA